MPIKRSKLIAIAVGVLLACAPMAAFHYWVDIIIDRQGAEDVDAAAHRTLRLAEARVKRTVATLEELARQDVDFCSADAVNLLRQKIFSSTAIKEISVVDEDGSTRCSDMGGALEKRTVISSQSIEMGGEQGKFDLVRVTGRDATMVRLRLPHESGKGLAALIPAESLVPMFASQQAPTKGISRLTMRDGILVAQNEEWPADDELAASFFGGSLMSVPLGLKVDIALPQSITKRSYATLQQSGLIFSGIVSILTLLFGLFGLPRQRDNPIAALDRALRAGEFIPYYQPIVDVVSGKLKGAEVLVRWRKPDGTIVSPAAFIPLAESSGIIVDMTRSLMQQVRRELGEVIKSRPHMRVSFNIAARHFENEQIVSDIRSIFSRGPLTASQLVLELTERQPIGNLTETRRLIATLQGLGVRVAIDDVGIGHGGLSYILKLGVDIIKIDKMFIDAIGIDRSSTTIVETLVDLAHNMRMEVVAEGVETFEQVNYIRERGIRLAQGFVFAPPLPGSVFLQLVEAIDPLRKASAVDGEVEGRSATRAVA